MRTEDQHGLVALDAHLHEAIRGLRASRTRGAHTGRVLLRAVGSEYEARVIGELGSGAVAAVVRARQARRTMEHLAIYVEAARTSCGDVASEVRAPVTATAPVEVDWVVRAGRDLNLLGRLCALADEVGADAERRLALAAHATQLVRDRLADVSHDQDPKQSAPTGALGARMDELAVGLERDRNAVGEVRARVQAAGRITNRLAAGESAPGVRVASGAERGRREADARLSSRRRTAAIGPRR